MSAGTLVPYSSAPLVPYSSVPLVPYSSVPLVPYTVGTPVPYTFNNSEGGRGEGWLDWSIARFGSLRARDSRLRGTRL